MKLYHQLPDYLPWWMVDVLVLAVWSLMFGAYVAWITAEGIYYRKSLQE